MRVPVEPAKNLRFGEFEINLQTAELRRNGQRSVLQGQPFQVLAILLEHPGELVTREELKRRLWSANTFVDFDHSLNKAVNRLREALQDSAEQPRYVQTISRRGYRLIVPVEFAEETPSVLATAAPPSDTQRTSFSSEPLPTKHRGRGLALITLSGAIALASLVALRQYVSRTSKIITGIQSLAVLPLENLSHDPSQDYFSDGMTDAMITDLGEIGSLRVISRTSAMQYKGAHKPLPEIARELSVDAIIEGTVLRSGDRVRITAQLIDARADKHLWAQSYEGDIHQTLSLQSEVAADIASQIRVKLTPQQQQTAVKLKFSNIDAQDNYLRGHYFAEKGTIPDLQKALAYFNQAIEKEPLQAPVYAGLATTYVTLGHIMYLSPQEAFPPAKAAALKALALDNKSVEAHTALADVKFLYDWDFPGAEREFRVALELSPNSVAVQKGYADYLNAMGHHGEAVALAEHILQIDPLSLSAITDLAWELYWARRYDEAIIQARKVTEIDASYYPAHVCLGLAYEQKHRFASSIAELQSAVGFCRGKCFGLIGQVSALSGDRAGALDALRQLQHRPYVSPWLVAIVYSELGDKDMAFRWLEKSYEGREHDLAYSNVWPMFDSLRQDSRFKDLMHRIGLPEIAEPGLSPTM
jgi:TolB-like protein/DNA-binding winged helix-turn-helix (wHTH) protein